MTLTPQQQALAAALATVKAWQVSKLNATTLKAGQAALVSATAPFLVDATPPVVVPPVITPDGTVIEAGGKITTGPAVFGIVNFQVTINGVPDPRSSDVVKLLWKGGALYQLNKWGQVWTEPLTGGPGVLVTDQVIIGLLSGNNTPPPPVSSPPAQQGTGVPPAPAPAGWRVVFEDGFDTPVKAGDFPGMWDGDIGGKKWYSYDGNGGSTSSVNYSRNQITIGQQYPSCMELNLTPQGVCSPGIAGLSLIEWRRRDRWRLTEGSDGRGYHPAWLGWPQEPVEWQGGGEIDFPEGELDDTVRLYVHSTVVGSAANNVLAVNTGIRFDDHKWHETDTIVTQSGAEFWIDGKQIGKLPKGDGVPTHPMRFTYQTEGRGTSQGKALLLIDSVQILTPA